jgi:hypothetical protein
MAMSAFMIENRLGTSTFKLRTARQWMPDRGFINLIVGVTPLCGSSSRQF